MLSTNLQLKEKLQAECSDAKGEEKCVSMQICTKDEMETSIAFEKLMQQQRDAFMNMRENGEPLPPEATVLLKSASDDNVGNAAPDELDQDLKEVSGGK